MSYPHQLADFERRELLRIARVSLREFTRSGRLPPGKPHCERMLEGAAAFVTLRRGSVLRGCIGTQEETTPLYRVIQEMAVAAACRDPRFNPVTPDEVEELKIEISVLGERERIHDPSEIEIGRHGLLINADGRRGLLLPQVAEANGWSAEVFLARVCAKAGLSETAWRDPETLLERFSAQVFEEEAAESDEGGLDDRGVRVRSGR